MKLEIEITEKQYNALDQIVEDFQLRSINELLQKQIEDLIHDFEVDSSYRKSIFVKIVKGNMK
jgi:hypothetical protein